MRWEILEAAGSPRTLGATVGVWTFVSGDGEPAKREWSVAVSTCTSGGCLQGLETHRLLSWGDQGEGTAHNPGATH